MDITDSKIAADIINQIAVILQRGNDVLIQNRKNGIVVIEQKKNIVLKIENSELNEQSKMLKAARNTTKK